MYFRRCFLLTFLTRTRGVQVCGITTIGLGPTQLGSSLSLIASKIFSRNHLWSYCSFSRIRNPSRTSSLEPTKVVNYYAWKWDPPRTSFKDPDRDLPSSNSYGVTPL
ncbi:Hypothetical protein NTJ_05943 [Nesidiocoris tenuis]|uniref:Uncharacterized protein n=1 Tax=Nesidiocoris tenuis TaxID=355587 RepID=A0ABN7AQD9_9HEMI|nr:Hypothetical protein NTJ_05943 [Nesidiocoris tenuis]